MGVRFQAGAIRALQEGVEAYLVRDFEAANVFVCHSKRVTVMPKDLRAVKSIKDIYGLK